MKVNIAGLHVDLGANFQEYATAQILKEVQKYYDHPIHADIKVDKQGHLFHIEMLVNDGMGRKSLSKAISEGTDIYKTFDLCINRLDRQLTKYKHRLNDLHRRRLEAEKYAIAAIDYTIDSSESEEMPSDDTPDNPLIIAENSTNIERLTVKDAVMKLEIMHLPALAFINDASGRMNFIYLRHDGNITWIDTK